MLSEVLMHQPGEAGLLRSNHWIPLVISSKTISLLRWMSETWMLTLGTTKPPLPTCDSITFRSPLLQTDIIEGLNHFYSTVVLINFASSCLGSLRFMAISQNIRYQFRESDKSLCASDYSVPWTYTFYANEGSLRGVARRIQNLWYVVKISIRRLRGAQMISIGDIMPLIFLGKPSVILGSEEATTDLLEIGAQSTVIDREYSWRNCITVIVSFAMPR